MTIPEDQPDAGAVTGGQPGDRLAAPGRWRRKGDEIEALHWDGTVMTATVLIDWILANDWTARYHDDPSCLVIDIPGGSATAVPGDWIAKDADGVFWAWPDLEFARDYESADTRSALADADNAIGQVIRLAESWRMAGGRLDASHVTGVLLDICAPWTGMPVRELEAIGTGPLLDPDCRDGKHSSCVGGLCECEHHKRPEAGHG